MKANIDYFYYTRRQLFRQLALMAAGTALCRLSYAGVSPGGHWLTVNGKPVALQPCRVSAVPFNQVWPGYQRPVDQTEQATFATWDMTTQAHVELVSAVPVRNVIVRPLAADIKAVVSGATIRFTVPRPMNLVVEINGSHQAVHLFANPPVAIPLTQRQSSTHYFGVGTHNVGLVELASHDSVYLEEGAVVYGCFYAQGAEGITISGRGIIDVSKLERGQGRGAIRLQGCSNCQVHGVILRDPDQWCFGIFGSSDIHIDRVKLVGLWRYNADGIDVCNSQRVLVSNCFVRSFDDGLVVKGLKGTYQHLPVEDVRFEHCVVWCDWGKAFEIGAETVAPYMRRIAYSDCDIIHTSYAAMNILHGDNATIQDVSFTDIRVELDAVHYQPKLQAQPQDRYTDVSQGTYVPKLMEVRITKTDYSQSEQLGTLDGVVFTDVAVVRAPGSTMPDSVFQGENDHSRVKNVTFRHLTFNGKPLLSASEAQVTTNGFVEPINFITH